MQIYRHKDTLSGPLCLVFYWIPMFNQADGWAAFPWSPPALGTHPESGFSIPRVLTPPFLPQLSSAPTWL